MICAFAVLKTLICFFSCVENIFLRKYRIYQVYCKSLSAGDIFGRLLITHANSLDPDQAQHFVGQQNIMKCLSTHKELIV